MIVADTVLRDAAEPAKQALLDAVDPAEVGAHLRTVAEEEFVVSHVFECLAAGYRGWTWSVVLTRTRDSDRVTVNEIVLLPGEGAIVAPEWKPYRDRIEPGDLSPGDILPPDDDDIRLVPAWQAGDGEEDSLDRAFAREVGLGRERVLSLEGRIMAADRWLEGEPGPDSPLAKQAPGRCGNCGFLVSLAGPLSSTFGVCANGMANDDAQVVSFDHGCGAHSDAKLSRSAAPQELPPPYLDTVGVDDIADF